MVGGEVSLGFTEAVGHYVGLMRVEFSGDKAPDIIVGTLHSKIAALSPEIKEKFQDLCKESVTVLLKKMQEDIPEVRIGEPQKQI